MLSIVVLNAGDDINVVMTDKAGMIAAFETEQKALEYFEGGYTAGHRRSYESSMSACIHAITFRPKVLTFNDFDELKAALFAGSDQGSKINFNNLSGFYTGIVIPDNETTKELLNKGVEPKIFDPDRVFGE